MNGRVVLRAVWMSALGLAYALPAAPVDAQEPPYSYRIAYATYFGGSHAEEAREIIAYRNGSILIGGQTQSDDMPVTPGVVQPEYGGEPAGTGHPGLVSGDMFLARLSADGSRITASTYFGGSKQERNTYGMALDRRGNIVITSLCRSPDVATTPGAFQRAYGGGSGDIVVAKLSPDLKRAIWVTYLGGSKHETPRGGLAMDGDDNVTIVGNTDSDDFPLTPGAFRTKKAGKNDVTITKLSSDGSRVLWAARLGGDGDEDIMSASIDAAGNVRVVGHTSSSDFPTTPHAPQPKHGGAHDMFVAALSPDGKRLLHSTYIGGAGEEWAEHGQAIFGRGNVIVVGVTLSDDYPTRQGAVQRELRGKSDGVVVGLSGDGRRVAFSTMLGGSSGEMLLQPKLDARGGVYVVGQTSSRDFPVSDNAIQKTYAGGPNDGVFAILSRDGSRVLYATYLGGSGDDLIRSMTLGPNGTVYLIGRTDSKDFPITKGAAQTSHAGAADAFVVKLEPTAAASGP